MLTPTFTSHFKKERKLMQKRGKDTDELSKMLTVLVNEQPLLPKHEDHPLRGNWSGCRECHIEPDWLLIYEIDNANGKIIFHRTGSHSDLF